MKKIIDIPEVELQEAIRHTGAKTKREAVVIALSEFNRRQRLQALTKNRDAEIEKLYAEIHDLIVRSAGDPNLKNQVEPLRARLREQQEEEAAEVEQYFDERLCLKPGTGYQVLEEAKRLRGR